MRLLGVLVLAVLMYFAVPLLWQRAMVAKVQEISATSPDIPTGNAIAPVDLNLTINAINPRVEINTEEYERIGVQSQADQAIRQAQAAQDQAWRATH